MKRGLIIVNLSVLVTSILIIGFVSAGFFGNNNNNKITGKVVSSDPTFTLTDEFDFWEDRSTHGYEVAGVTSKGVYQCASEGYCIRLNCGDETLRLGYGKNGGGEVSVDLEVTPWTDEIVLVLNSAWCNQNSGNVFDLTIDGVSFSDSINWNELNLCGSSCQEKEIPLSGLSDYTQDGKINIKISDAHPEGWEGDSQLTYLKVYSKEVSGVTPPEPTPTTTCTDSDGGKNIYIKGITEGYHTSDIISVREDSCLLKQTGIEGYESVNSCEGQSCNVFEYWAELNDPIVGACSGEILSCPNGCFDGACAYAEGEEITLTIDSSDSTPDTTPTCTDSDSGLDYFMKGKTNSSFYYPEGYWGIQIVDDVCINNILLQEQACNSLSGLHKPNSYECPNGCLDGACITEDTITTTATTPTGNITEWFAKRTYNFEIWTGSEPDCSDVTFSYGSNSISPKQSTTSEADALDITDFGTNYRNYCQQEIAGESLYYIHKNAVWTNQPEVYSETVVCTDTDGGLNYSVKGHVEDIRGFTATDVCNTEDNPNELIEFKCEDDGRVSGSYPYLCPEGCLNGACIGEIGIIDSTVEIIDPVNEPIDIPEDETGTGITCSGCILDDKCYPFGFRKSGEFCSDDNSEFIIQLEENLMCENNFECDSNVCISGECVSGGLFQRILDFFRALFGAD